MGSGDLVLRNTPTHVGKTRCAAAEAGQGWKHPHARGEDISPVPRQLVDLETPPRTWGRQAATLGPSVVGGNTPTHVGKTQPEPETVDYDRKHPHARGEDSVVPGRSAWMAETPPRTWGRHSSSAFFAVFQRNTPTHVGKTETGKDT